MCMREREREKREREREIISFLVLELPISLIYYVYKIIKINQLLKNIINIYIYIYIDFLNIDFFLVHKNIYDPFLHKEND